MADIKISELTTASQINNNDNIELSQDSGGGSLVSLKATILAVATKIVKGINFTSDLQTTDKTIIGAINEAAQGGGGGSSSLAGLSDVDIDDQTLDDDQVLVWDSVSEKWVNANQSGQGGTTVVANPSGTPTDDLETIQIGNTIYNLVGSGGSGGGITETVLLNTIISSNGTYSLNDDYTNYDMLGIYFCNSNQTIAAQESDLITVMVNDVQNLMNDSKKLNLTGYGDRYINCTFNEDEITILASNAAAIQKIVGYNVGDKMTEVSGTLAAGETEITLVSSAINGNSTVEPFTSKFGLSPTDMIIGEANYTYSSFMDGKIIVRENNDDNTDIKLFVCGLTKTASDITITDNDLLAYLSDITSGYLKACETFDTADSTTQTGILAMSNDSGTMLLRTYVPGWTQYKAGTFYGMIDLNEPPVVGQGAPQVQMNEYSDPYDVGGSVTLTFPVQSSNVNVKVRVS